jgi:hypothetical protein
VLKIGQTATVSIGVPGPLGVLSPPAKLRITVTGMTRGDETLSGGFRQYNLRYRLTNLGRTLPASASQFLLVPDVVTAEGLEGGAEGTSGCTGAGCVAAASSCPQIPSHPFPHGKTWALCSVYLLSTPPKGVVYSGDGPYVVVVAA